MRSRAARLIVSAVSAAALVACAVFLFRAEKQLSALDAHRRAFNLQAHGASSALADMRAGQQAYVSVGQGVGFWAPKVTETQDLLTKTLASLRESAASTGAQSALDEVAATLTQFAEVDKRARDYVKGGQQLMAGDVVFTEGVETAANAQRQLEAARQAEEQALDAAQGNAHKLEADALGATAGLAALSLLLLAFGGGTSAAVASSTLAIDQTAGNSPDLGSMAAPSRAVSPVLKTAADLCTDFGRVRDADGLQKLVSRAADMMDAGGLVVWMGNTSGGDLKPVLTHGYSEVVRARMPNVPRTADNAAAAAYRTGTLQIVPYRPAGNGVAAAPGAIVAPMISADGCIGAFSAEIRGGGEGSESVQALATILAAQLAGILTPTAAESTTEPKAAQL